MQTEQTVWHRETPFLCAKTSAIPTLKSSQQWLYLKFYFRRRASCNLHIMQRNVSAWWLWGHLVSITVLVFLLPRSRHVGRGKERWGWFPWLQLACFFFCFFFTAADHRGRWLPVLLITSVLWVTAVLLSWVREAQPVLRKTRVQPGWCHEENKYRCGYFKTSICCRGDVHNLPPTLTHFALCLFTVNHLLMQRRENLALNVVLLYLSMPFKHLNGMKISPNCGLFIVFLWTTMRNVHEKKIKQKKRGNKSKFGFRGAVRKN